MNTLSIFVVFLLSCCVDLVYSAAGCVSCPKGSNPIDCVDKYEPPFILNENVCQSIRNQRGEVSRLCKKYGGNYLVKCELEDYSERACVSTCLQTSPRKGVVDSRNNGQTLQSPAMTLFALTTLCFFFLKF
ncbi:hypothetical protein LOTGIDRAFT_229538 [Lottia gigantea]|uniref:Uncharacterized protein n=1 Tax=Lottia gigantea TaxID=225164 RepID=V3ZNE2_LOTGI|nr:hypothetical protein LOTGIDRAFT_229538 [Lottia gigantea]ESO83980.1 hypothetical protein LOTGIDRAFT_229538 [Lottia gigantea]